MRAQRWVLHACAWKTEHDMSPLLALLARAALVQLAEDEEWPAGWVFDGRKNIYAPLDFKGGRRLKFLSQDEQSYEVWTTATSISVGGQRARAVVFHLPANAAFC